MTSATGPASSKKGSPFVPADVENFITANGVNRLDDPVPVAATAAKEWIIDCKNRGPAPSQDESSASPLPSTITIEGFAEPIDSACIATFTDATSPGTPQLTSGQISFPQSVCSLQTAQCLVKLLQGKPDEFLPYTDSSGADSDEEMDQQLAAASRQRSVPLKTAVELFAAAQHLGVTPRLWQGLLVYLQPMLTELAMEEAAWMAVHMLAVAPPAHYRAALAALFNRNSMCVPSGPESEQSRLFHANEPALGVLGGVFWRMATAVLSEAPALRWDALVPAIAANPHIPSPIVCGLLAAGCLLCPDGPDGSTAGRSLGETLDSFLSHLLTRGPAMGSVCAMFAEATGHYEFGPHEGAADAVAPRLRALGEVAGRATAATASDARSRASGEDAGGSQDGDSGSLDMGRQAGAVERVLRHEAAARGLAAAGRGDCFMLRWGLHTCPAFRIAVARLQIPATDGEAASAAAGNVAMAVSCVEPRLGGCGDAAAADCALGVTVRYACESEGAAAMLFAQAAAEAERSTTAQWSRAPGAAAAGRAPRGGPEVFVHAVGVLPTPRSASQSGRLADALCAVQEAWEGDWGVRETEHDWYALSSDGTPVPMIHRVVEGGGMEMQPGSTAGVNNLWGVAGFAQEAFCWGGQGSGLLGKEVFVYACLEMQSPGL